MKLRIDRDILAGALTLCGPASYLWFKAEYSGLTVGAIGDDYFFTPPPVLASVEEPGEAMLYPDQLRDALISVSPGAVGLAADAGEARLGDEPLSYLEPSPYRAATAPLGGGAAPALLDAAALSVLLKKVSYAASTDELRPPVAAVCLEVM